MSRPTHPAIMAAEEIQRNTQMIDGGRGRSGGSGGGRQSALLPLFSLTLPTEKYESGDCPCESGRRKEGGRATGLEMQPLIAAGGSGELVTDAA